MDHISKLPDEILINILSRLTIEEAGRTSILSNRWRYLWTYFTGSLDFIDPYITRHLAICSDPYYVFEDEGIIIAKRHNFIDRVDEILGSLQSQIVQQLRICFPIDSDYDVDDWVQFAFEKRVQRLELDFSQEGRTDHELHVFLPCFETSSSFSSLMSLRLSDVDIPEEVLKFLLWNCPLLEVLRLKGAESLVSVNVSAPSLKLKYLELRDLPNLDELEIDAANLESFGYCGRELNVFFKHVPSLTEMSIEGEYCTYTLYNLHQLSSFLAQLSTLKLNLETVTVPEDVLNSIPKLPNLKHLEMTISTADVDCFHTCVAFLKASPFLHEFTLKVFLTVEPCQYIQNIKDHPLLNLRLVSFIGFDGREADIKFLKDLLENAVMLEKIIIDPCKLNFMGNAVEWLYRSGESYKSARKCAIELAEKFPRLEFVIPEIFTPAAR